MLSVAAGRILVQRADGSLELRRGADGGLLRAFPSGPWYERVAVLDSAELVVLDRTSGRHWRVYDPVSGEQTRVLEAPVGAIPADVERGLLVYTVGRVVHVLRLADGRERTFVAPKIRGYARQFVFAQIEPTGLFYSYSVRGGGRRPLRPLQRDRAGSMRKLTVLASLLVLVGLLALGSAVSAAAPTGSAPSFARREELCNRA